MLEINQVENILEEIKRGLPSTDSEVISSEPPSTPTPQKKRQRGKNHNQSSNVTVISRGATPPPPPPGERPPTPIVGYNVTISSVEENMTKHLPPKAPKLPNPVRSSVWIYIRVCVCTRLPCVNLWKKIINPNKIKLEEWRQPQIWMIERNYLYLTTITLL